MQETNTTQDPRDDAQAGTFTADAPPPTEQAGAPDAPAGAAESLAQVQSRLDEAQENFLRAKAETENVRRRGQEDVAKAHKFAIERFAEYLVPVVDSLEAALADRTADPAKVREGVELTLRQLGNALEKGSVVPINPVGEKFDPHRHQAISMVPSEQEPNTVVAVLQKGYLLADRVLRPALVTVSQPK